MGERSNLIYRQMFMDVAASIDGFPHTAPINDEACSSPWRLFIQASRFPGRMNPAPAVTYPISPPIRPAQLKSANFARPSIYKALKSTLDGFSLIIDQCGHLGLFKPMDSLVVRGGTLAFRAKANSQMDHVGLRLSAYVAGNTMSNSP